MLDVIVRGGLVVREDGVTRADVAIADGVIARVEPEVTEAARAELDATGLHVFPGVVDAHVHFNEPGQAHWEGLATGSRALAAGGGTLFVDMPLNNLPCTLTGDDFDAKVRAARASSVTDFALWGGLTPDSLVFMEEVAARGAAGFKAFMSESGLPEFRRADEDTLRDGMRIAARLGLPVAVHAEDEFLTSALAAEAVTQGRTGWRDYVASRPVRAELNAIAVALRLARETGCALHIVHVSSGAGVALALEGRAAGADVSIETCPHYLAFTEEDLERVGAALKCAPPVRDARTREELWAQVLAGGVDTIGSDHSPSPPDLKTGEDAFRIWGGIAGVQSTLAAVLTEGERHGLPVTAVARLLAGNPARRLRLAGRGEVREGFSADLALVDTREHFTLQAADLHQRHKLSPYVERVFRGVVRATLIRGRPVFRQGRFDEAFRAELVRPAPRSDAP